MRRASDRGAVLVEMAIASVFVFILLFGIIEFGLLIKNDLALGNASRTGARVGSAAGQSASSDYQVLQAIRGGLAALSGSVDRIVIFKAANPSDASPPPPCDTAQMGVGGLCNVYQASDLTAPESSIDCSTGAGKSCFWSSSSRNIVVGGAVSPDYLGVRIDYTHQFLTRFFGVTKSLSETTLMRLEPSS